MCLSEDTECLMSSSYNKDRLSALTRELDKPIPDPTPLICAALLLACCAILFRIVSIW